MVGVGALEVDGALLVCTTCHSPSFVIYILLDICLVMLELREHSKWSVHYGALECVLGAVIEHRHQIYLS